MSEALKSNTTLTELGLGGKSKRKDTQMRFIRYSLFFYISTGNSIGDTGTTSLSGFLKSNTTLTKLSLSGKDKRKTTHK